jgi:endonuclease G
MYVVEHSPSRKTPYWSAEYVVADNLKIKKKRVNAFRADPDLPSRVAAHPSDYDGSGWDQGHASPVGNMYADTIAMLESFYLSNMFPHHPKNNRVGWRVLESIVREQAIARGAVYVITGPIYDSKVDVTIGKNKVAVPTRLYKIVVDPRHHVTMSFIAPNSPLPASELPFAIVKIADVEKATGITFFPLLRLPFRESTMIWTDLTSD